MECGGADLNRPSRREGMGLIRVDKGNTILQEDMLETPCPCIDLSSSQEKKKTSSSGPAALTFEKHA
eukprot:7362480-Prorocentrum_lima.AAC.1